MTSMSGASRRAIRRSRLSGAEECIGSISRAPQVSSSEGASASRVRHARTGGLTGDTNRIVAKGVRAAPSDGALLLYRGFVTWNAFCVAILRLIAGRRAEGHAGVQLVRRWLQCSSEPAHGGLLA
jgi:hypothetical protein